MKLKYAIISESLTTRNINFIYAHEFKKPCMDKLKQLTKENFTAEQAEEGITVSNFRYRLLRLGK
jgi:hypothetical protein